MKILLDTSFILTCIKENKDFLEAEKYGNLLLPEGVLEELRKKKETGKKESKLARIALDIINKNKNKFEIIILNEKHVDEGIVKYANKKIIVATMDREMKKKLSGKSRILTLKAKKRIEIV